MKKACWLVLCLFLLALHLWARSVSAVEKLVLATPIKGSPYFLLPPVAGEEKGFFEREGLKVEWLPFVSGVAMGQAMITGRVHIGLANAGAPILRRGAGVPMVVVADLEGFKPWFFWVRADSPRRSSKDLKGAKIGVDRIGGLNHAYSMLIAKGLGLEKEVKYPAMGGILEMLAAIQSGVVDVIVNDVTTMARLEHEGVVRRYIPLADFVPAKDWDPLTLYTIEGFVGKEPEQIRKMVRAMVGATGFIVNNPTWSLEKMKAELRWPEPVTKKVVDILAFSKDGRIYPDRIRLMRDFMVEYGVIKAEKVPDWRRLYTEKFAPIE